MRWQMGQGSLGTWGWLGCCLESVASNLNMPGSWGLGRCSCGGGGGGGDSPGPLPGKGDSAWRTRTVSQSSPHPEGSAWGS